MFSKSTRIALPLLILGLALACYRVAFNAVRPELPAISQRQPHTIRPQRDWPAAVTDEQLLAVLRRVQPPRALPLTNNLVHALRLWGQDAKFASDAHPSGVTMLRYLLDDATFREIAGPNAAPLWVRDPHGIRPRSFEDDPAHTPTSSYHTDDLLATLAEAGVALDEPLHLRDGSRGCVRDVLACSLDTFYLKRFEYEWTMIAFARYGHPLPFWMNRYGERIDARSLVQEMINHPLEVGPCNGLHRLEAMTLLYRADDRFQQLAPPVRKTMLAHMQRVSRLLQGSQSVEGYWVRSWPAGQAPNPQTAVPLNEKLLVTGHQLEWLALAPDDALPPRETIVRACQWLARTLPELEERQVVEYYGPLSHAARALCLWRGGEAYESWRRITGEEIVAP